MTVTQILQDFRTSWAGCQMLTFADLGAQMPLVTVADRPQTQEAQDQLCAQAVALLPFAAQGIVLVALRGHTCIHLRSPSDPDDALCCICAADMPLEPFIAAARACLEQISQKVGHDR